MKILFRKQGIPYTGKYISRKIDAFGSSYNRCVLGVIDNSKNGLDKKVFYENVAMLMPNFKMTRAGPFKGIRYSNGVVKDPKRKIRTCWEEIGHETVKLRNFLDGHKKGRARVLVEIPRPAQEEVASGLWEMFKRLVSLCMGKNTLGLVAASKVLFAVLPEVALPIDNAEWRTVFRTIDYGDIITQMAEEITEWEKIVRTPLDSCDPYPLTTLPSVYNVMAMRARHQTKKPSML